MLKLSAPDWCFYKEGTDPAEYYGMLAEIGYRGVEMVDPSRWDAARSAGLEITNMASDCIERGLNRLEHHTDLLPSLRELIALAGDNNIPHVIIYSGNREGQADQEGIANCRQGIEPLLPDAEAAGVTLVFEMLNTFDHPDHQASRGAYGFELARAINHPNLKLVYDIYHMERMGCDSASEIIANLDLIALLHVADTPRRDVPKAKGGIPYQDIVPKVAAAGYDGYWGMEFEPGEDVVAELKEAFSLFNELA